MRIAIFADSFYPELSGIADSILISAKELAKKGNQITFFVPAYSKKEFDIANTDYEELELDPNISIKRIRSFSINMPSGQGRGTIPNIFRGFFWKNKFDIVHTHSFYSMGIESYCFAKINNIPLVGTNHTVVESFLEFAPKIIRKFLPKYQIWFYNLCNYVTVPSKFILEAMQKNNLKTESQVLSNPIENEVFISKSGKELIQSNTPNKKFTFLYVGRISKEKNVEIVVDSFHNFIINNKYDNIELLLIGNGILLDEIKSKVKKYKGENYIKILGSYMGENKYKLYDEFKKADAFITASLSEVQPMTILQAMASNLSILVANNGALKNLVEKDRGITFDPFDKNDIEKTIKYIYINKEIRENITNNASEFVKKYSSENIANLRENIYNQTIKNYKNI